MSNLLASFFTAFKVNLTLDYMTEREAGLIHIREDLLQEFPDLIADKVRLEKFNAALEGKLSAGGKAMYGNGLDQALINQCLAPDFKKEYELVLAESIEKLKEHIDTQKVIENNQTCLQEKLKSKKSKLVGALISALSAEQGFSAEDRQHLETCFHAYLDDISQQLGATLKRIKPESIQARLQLDSANSASAKIDKHLTVIGDRKLEQLHIAPQAAPLAPAYKINIADLSKRIKHSLANLKPGEKINIEVSLPLNREDSLKRIAEQGLQYRLPLVALLLLIFIQLRMIKKDDETRVYEAIKKLAVDDGIPIDPSEIKFKVSSIDNNGKTQVLAEALSPQFIQQLKQIRQEFDEQLKQKWSSDPSKKLPLLQPSESGYNSEEDDEDVANTAPPLSPQLSRTL